MPSADRHDHGGPDICLRSRNADTPVVPDRPTTHDGVVTTTAHPPEPGCSGTGTRDLEEFWPSRRGHAYDEFCR